VRPGSDCQRIVIPPAGSLETMATLNAGTFDAPGVDCAKYRNWEAPSGYRPWLMLLVWLPKVTESRSEPFGSKRATLSPARSSLNGAWSWSLARRAEGKTELILSEGNKPARGNRLVTDRETIRRGIIGQNTTAQVQVGVWSGCKAR
jgi:hypothetical protein